MHDTKLNFQLTEKCLHSIVVFGPYTLYILTMMENFRTYNIRMTIFLFHHHYHIWRSMIHSLYAKIQTKKKLFVN